MTMSTTTTLLKNYINGQWVSANTDRSEIVPNPATGEILAHVPTSR